MASIDSAEVGTDNGERKGSAVSSGVDAFQEELHNERRNQSVSEVAESRVERFEASTGEEQSIVDPYEKLMQADQLSQELERIEKTGLPADTLIEVRRADGSNVTLSVAERVKELKTEVKENLSMALIASDAIRQSGPDSVEQFISENIQERNKLRDHLGLKDADLNPENLQKQFAETRDPERRQNLEALWDVLQQREQLEKLRRAPAYSRLLAAEFTANGHANPDIKYGDSVPGEDFARAFELMKSAGRSDSELETTDVFAQAERRISLLYAANQQERSQKIIEEMQLATESLQKGEQGAREEHLLKAIELVDKVDIAFLVQQSRLPQNQSEEISRELKDIISIAGFARLDYAKFLSEQGRPQEAQLQLNKVKTTSPDLLYVRNPNTGALEYRDASVEELDRKITMGSNASGVSWEVSQSRFMQSIQSGDHRQASIHLSAMQQAQRQSAADIEIANKVLDREKVSLAQELRQLEEKGEPSETERIEMERIKSEIELIEATIKQRDAQSSRQGSLTRFMDGLLSLSQEDFSRAHGIFNEVKRVDPELANIEELGLNDKIELTQGGLKGWWNRNWRVLALGAAVVAGVAVAVGTLGVGSVLGAGMVAGVAGGLGVSTATAAGVVTIGTAVTATALGAAAGGAAHWGVERTVNQDAGLESFMTGAKVGGLSAGMVASPWAASALGASGAVTGAATGTSLIARAASGARYVGITRNSLAAGYTMSGTIEGINYLAGEKDGSTALRDFAVDGAVNTLMLGIAAKWGVASEVARTTGTSGRTISSMVGLGKDTAAIGFGTAGLAEAANFYNGHKDIYQSGRDFLVGGSANTLTVGLLKNYAFGNEMMRMSNPFAQAGLYGAKGLVFNEGFNIATNQALTGYLQHDILGQDTSIARNGLGFISPLVADSWDRHIDPGLNPNHAGESGRWSDNIVNMGQDFASTIAVDRKYLEPLELFDPDLSED